MSEFDNLRVKIFENLKISVYVVIELHLAGSS